MPADYSFPAPTDKSDRKRRHEHIRAQLENERASFIPHWRDLGNFILPRRPRFFVQDRNRGDRRTQNILDSSASLAVRTLRSGMMVGLTSPTRPWFRLTTPEPHLAEEPDVKIWLYMVTNRMSTIFIRSNLYRSLPIVYGDLGVFGTAAMLIEEDMDTLFRTFPLPIGSYMIAVDADGKVNLFFREFEMTVRQIVDEFLRQDDGSIDWSLGSSHIKSLWESNSTEQGVEVCHIIERNEDYDPRKFGSKKWASYYYERGISNQRGYVHSDYDEKYLRESGYDMFPVLCPRWEVTGEDAYGTDCPAMTALGDIKQLQIAERRGLQGLDKMVNPPVNAPASTKNSPVSLLPGGVNYKEGMADSQGVTPVYELKFSLEALENKQAQVRDRIRRAFFEDVFLMLSTTDRREITAEEIRERHEEKMIAIGPVLEQLNSDLLDPLIDITFDLMLKQGLLPPPPEVLQGMPLRVEYISVLAQAQKMAGLSSIERFAQFAGQVAQFDPQVLDKINRDELIDVYADAMSVPPSIVVSDDVVAEIRTARAKAQADAARVDQLREGSVAAKNLGNVDMTKDTMLSRLAKAAAAGELPIEGGPAEETL